MYDIWCCLLLAALEADLSWEIPVEYTILRLLLRCLKTLKANTFWTRQKRCSFIGFPWKSHTVTSFVLYWSTGQPGRRYCSMGKCQAIQTGSKSFIIQCCKILISAYNDYLVLLNFKFGVCFEELFFFFLLYVWITPCGFSTIVASYLASRNILPVLDPNITYGKNGSARAL